MQPHAAEFVHSLTGVTPATAAVYRRDLDAFTEWLVETGIDEITDVDRRVLRRYLAHLDHRGYARRTIARKMSSLRRYFDDLRRCSPLCARPVPRHARSARHR